MNTFIKLFCCCVLAFTAHVVQAQHGWFTLYSDSTALVQDANAISAQFIAEVLKVEPALPFKPNTILNTKPF